ncbi:MAG: RagB/SusD family nutrient uptake outer membrane protein [Bacteroidota bacterium]
MKHLRKTGTLRLTILIAMMILSSCSDWLSIAPENDLIKEKYWKKTADVESALAASYNALRDASMKSLIFGELRADLVIFQGAGEFADYSKIAGSDISPSNPVINWNEYYKAINLANTMMHYDDEVSELDGTFTEELQNTFESEARFIRSMAYFYLVRIWKDVPLVREATLSDTSDIFIEKSSEYEVIDYMIEDLMVARELARSGLGEGEVMQSGRANQYAITALLADIYLWNEQYQKCIDECDLLMNSGLFGLEPSETAFDVYYPGNAMNESILEIQYDDNLESQENPIYDRMIFGDHVILDRQNINMIMEEEDTRHYNRYGAIWKYIGKDQLGMIGRTITERDANWILYRYADILLMKAEASIELDRFNDANELIAETLLRAGMPYQEQTDKRLLREELLDERGREFLFEGKRWFDLLRAAKRDRFDNKQIIIDMILSGADIKQQAVLRTRVFDTLSYYLPIPEHEVLYNPSLQQNPFYDR